MQYLIIITALITVALIILTIRFYRLKNKQITKPITESTTKKELILKSLLPYLKGDKPYCIDEKGTCMNTIGDNHCAVAQWAKEKYQKQEESIPSLLLRHDQERVFEEGYANILTRDEWMCIMEIHDNTGKNSYLSSLDAVRRLSSFIKEPLDELVVLINKRKNEQNKITQ